MPCAMFPHPEKPSTSELIDWLQALVVEVLVPIVLKEMPFLGVLLRKMRIWIPY